MPDEKQTTPSAPQVPVPSAASAQTPVVSASPVTPAVPETGTFKLDAASGDGSGKKGMLANLMGGSAANGQNGNGSGNVFTKLFGKKELAAPEATSGQGTVLGPRPTIVPRSTVFTREIEKKKARTAAKVLIAIVLMVIVGVGYFEFMLRPDLAFFGPNVAMKLSTGNQEIKNIKTQINESNYRIARLYIDRINQLGDSFAYHTGRTGQDNLSANEKAASEAEISRLRPEIKASAAEVKNALSADISVPLYNSVSGVSETDLEGFKKALTASLNRQKIKLEESTDPQAVLEKRRLENMVQLVTNPALSGVFKNVDVENMDDGQIMEMLSVIQDVGGDDLSIVTKIKRDRVNWESVIADIENVTRKVDKLYGQGLYDEIGGVRYNGFDFDKSAGRISLNGSIKTEDSRTFTLMADLIDQFEKSNKFKDLEMKSFSKSEAEGEGYSSSLRLTFSLQEGDDPRDEI